MHAIRIEETRKVRKLQYAANTQAASQLYYLRVRGTLDTLRANSSSPAASRCSALLTLRKLVQTKSHAVRRASPHDVDQLPVRSKMRVYVTPEKVVSWMRALVIGSTHLLATISGIEPGMGTGRQLRSLKGSVRHAYGRWKRTKPHVD